MKVLFVYKYLTLGGVETVLAARLRALPIWGIEAHAWFFSDGPGRVIFESLAPYIHLGSAVDLQRFLEGTDFAILSSLDTEELFPTFSSLNNPAKLVIEAHSPYPESLEYLRHLGNLPVAGIFVPSQYQVGVIQKRLRRAIDIHVIPNPLDARFADELNDFNPKPPNPIIAWIGRLDEMKNWREYLKIAAILHQRMPQVEFWIVGRAVTRDTEKELYAQIKKSSLEQRLKWIRGLPYAYMPRLMDAVRMSGGVVVSTSKGDSFGLTIAEGMARGCAVVVPSEGPFREFVTDGVHGFIYQLGSPKEAAGRIDTLLKDDSLRSEFGQRGRVSILEKHSTDSAIRVLATALQQLIKG